MDRETLPPIPSLPNGMVRRDRIMKSIREANATKKHLFLSASGGFGKTVALLDWANRPRRKVAWLTVSEDEGESVRFFRRLAMALCTLSGMDKLCQDAVQYELAFNAGGVLRLMEQFPAKHTRTALIIDDAHLLRDSETLNGLALILSYMPSYIFIAIAGRNTPPSEFTDSGRFVILTQSDLAFTREETEELCIERGVQFSQEEMDNLYQATAGWPMALSAYISSGVEASESEVSTDSLHQYFAQQLWPRWDTATREALLLCALPEEIQPELYTRLTGRDDVVAFMERLIREDGVFVTQTGTGAYRFHDLLRDWLRERTSGELGEDGMRRARTALAHWYEELGEYFTAAAYYIQNRDDEGINRCIRESNRYSERSGNLSVETKQMFTQQYVMGLPDKYRLGNPYLLSKCANVAFLDGDADAFTAYVDMLGPMMPRIAAEYPDLLETVGFIGSLDFRVPLAQYANKMTVMLAGLPATREQEARASTMTQNLPFVHRSMRDFSEYHALDEGELEALYRPFNAMIGRDYKILHHSFIAGIHYEKNEMLSAVWHALMACRTCDETMQAESVFSASMMLTVILDAMGDHTDAGRVFDENAAYVESRAQFLYPNMLALRIARKLREGDTGGAQEWLTVHAVQTNHLPLYQIARHFTTLRCQIALQQWEQAVAFAKTLLNLATSYNRPIDSIETGILLAVALRGGGLEEEAVEELEKALHLAAQYGFTRRFVDEGDAVLPLLWLLSERCGNKDAAFSAFIDRVTSEIYTELNMEPKEEKKKPLKLSEQQKTMLGFLQQGLTYSEMADTLGLGRGTVKTHIIALYRKLDVSKAEEAIAKAKMMGLVY